MTRRLITTWGLLMGLTVLTGLAGVGGGERIGAAWLAVLAAVTIVKARLILARYLRLERAPSFLGGFTTAVVATVAIIAVSFMVLTRPLMPVKPGAMPFHPAASSSSPRH